MTTHTTSGPQLVVRTTQPYVAIPIRVALREWGRATALVSELFGWLAQQGGVLAGPPFFRYWVIGDMDRPFDLEVGLPLAQPLPGDGRVIAGSIPAGTYATLIHHGDPDQLVRSLALLEEWAAGQGIVWDIRPQDSTAIWAGRFEFYLTNPAEQPDRAQWATELAYLIREPAAGARAAAPTTQASDFPAGLSRPARQALDVAGYTRLEQLTACREADLLKLHGMGPKGIEILRRALAERGQSFAKR